MKVMVSACLLGDKVRYDGSHKYNKTIAELLKGHEIIKICPETHGGLTTPRMPSEIKNGRVIDDNGNDVTKFYNNGVNKDLENVTGVDIAILKSKSPACGYKEIYDGSFLSRLIEGNGVFTDELLKRGIRVFSENDIEELEKVLRHS